MNTPARTPQQASSANENHLHPRATPARKSRAHANTAIPNVPNVSHCQDSGSSRHRGPTLHESPHLKPNPHVTPTSAPKPPAAAMPSASTSAAIRRAIPSDRRREPAAEGWFHHCCDHSRCSVRRLRRHGVRRCMESATWRCILRRMRHPRTVLRCLRGLHSWATSEDSGGLKRWDCRYCRAHVLERECVEGVYDPDATDRPVMSHGGAAGGISASAG